MKYSELPRDEEGKIQSDGIDFPVNIPLLSPIRDGEAEVKSLALAEPTLGDMEIVSAIKGIVPGTRRLIALASGVDEDTLKRLGARDYRRINEVLDSFL